MSKKKYRYKTEIINIKNPDGTITENVITVYDNYFKDLNLSKEQKIKLKDKIFEVICDNDLDDSLAECYEDELYEYFREFAFKE